MSSEFILERKNLLALASDLMAAGTVVIAPVLFENQRRSSLEYCVIRRPEEIHLEGGKPERSLKEFFFPPSEVLFRWRHKKTEVELSENLPAFPRTVIFAARPCDAAGLEILDHVMGWDYRDEFWFGRRAATTVVTRACTDCDQNCFCTVMGLGPAAGRGADWLLSPTAEGFKVAVLSAKGEDLARQAGRFLSETESRTDTSHGDVEKQVHANLSARPEKIRAWLESNFSDPLWKEIGWRCHGCGACAFVCPTCHCFDIVDEPDSWDRGSRRRNWDTCQTALFTLHASGHNPRPDQPSRFRQRIMHKFSIYPARFGEILCTGCGRCIRTCAAGMDIIEILAQLDRRSAEEGM